MKKPKDYHSRKWLNKTGQGRISAEVSSDYGGGVSASLVIADCYRQITLDFNVFCYDNLKDGEREFKAKMDKISLIEEELFRLRQAIQERYDYWKAVEQPKNAEKRAKRKKNASLRDVMDELND